MNTISQRQVDETEMEPVLEGLIGETHDLVAINSLRNVRTAELAFLIAARTPLIALSSSYDSFFAIEWFCRHGLKSAIKAGLLLTIVSPRLIQRVCPHCAVPYELTPHQKEIFQIPADAQMKMNQGCEFCKDPENYSAELIFEYLQIDREVISWMESNYSASSLREAARKAGRKTLFDVALQRAVYGTIDMNSVMNLQPVL
jgi:type II secretory ATPase GspE/PulE/Tfp pilus assembly ATPase PilB-like protein